ncbi:MAG: dTMP kinase [Bacteroidales bacterium]|nr:dTMP kinase [Bacteroidales bacterium]
MALIVIEGVDGAGKSTQIRRLQHYLTDVLHRRHCHIHFPRPAESSVFSDLVARFLRGELGALEEVNPYLVALIYACDRADCRTTLTQHLDQGEVVILDRYVYSNVAYQCAKVPPEEADRLKKWILDLEFGYFGLPKPDVNLFLDVPFQFTRERLTAARTGKERDYLHGKSDIHEADLLFQQRVHDIYCTLSEEDRFVRIDCSGPGRDMLPEETIFQQILNRLPVL